mgnify:CR=1 FL=1
MSYIFIALINQKFPINKFDINIKYIIKSYNIKYINKLFTKIKYNEKNKKVVKNEKNILNIFN